MLDAYIYRGTQKLRCGYTTGSCAAAAAKAAAEMLLTGRIVQQVTLPTPKGITLNLEVCDPQMEEHSASCAIQKDGGDDPDITSGILIYAKAERIPQGIEIQGGKGIGTVTKDGLDQPKGNAAINRVPRQMITAAVAEICEQYEYRGGIRITIFAPDGEALARKTFNPRIGIVGGISIIGTTGIVEPMSSRALIDTIQIEIRMQRAAGKRYLLLTLGNYGKAFISEHFPFLENVGVTCSNFIGEAIDAAIVNGFAGVLLIGHVGKLVKLGAGIMNTHSAQADGRMEVLVTCGVLAGVAPSVLRKLPDCATVDAALEQLSAVNGLTATAEILMQRSQYYLNARAKGELAIGAIMFSDVFGIIGETEQAAELLDAIRNEIQEESP